MATGAWPSVVSTAAPIARKGAATRSMGRDRRLSSPVSTVRKGDAAKSPASSRVEVPEFPQSRSCEGSTSPERPSPSTSSGVADRFCNPDVPRGTVTLCVVGIVRSPRLECRSSLGADHRQGRSGRADVERRRNLDQSAGPSSGGGEDQPPMRDRFVAGNANPSFEVTARGDPHAHDRPSGQPERVEPGTGQHLAGRRRCRRRHGEVHRASTTFRRVHDLQVLDVDLAFARAPR